MRDSNANSGVELLQRELHLMRMAIDCASDAIKIADLDGRSIYHNKAFLSLFGYTVDQLIAAGGAPSLFADANVAAEVIGTVRAGGCWSGEVVVRNRSGRLITTLLRADQIKADGSDGLGHIGVFTDITKRKETEEELRKAHEFRQRVLEAATNAIAVIDFEGTFVLVNRRACEITGYSANELIGRPCSVVVAPEKLNSVVPVVLATLTERKPVAGFETDFVRKDGTRGTISFSVEPLEVEGGRASAVCTAEDITEKKRVEADLARAHQLAMIGKFVGGLAHLIRSRLAGIQGISEILLEQLPQETWREPLTMLRIEVGHIGRLVKALLDPTLPWSVQLHQTPFVEIVELMERTLDAGRSHAASMGNLEKIALVLVLQDHPPTLLLDLQQMQVALGNLVINAVESIEGSGIVTIRLRIDPASAVAVIEVEDTGRGIPEEDRETIFKPFYSTKPDGTGLGLSAVAAIVEGHGGHLDLIRSQEGSGSTFAISLPLL